MDKRTSPALRTTHPLRYAVGMFGTSIPINMFKTFAAFFYIDKLGFVTTPQFSLILLIYTFVDAIDNPVYGFLSDRTRTRWGRRRPWLLLGTPLLVLFFILFFNPPGFLSQGSMFYYMLMMYILTGTLDSLINSNYGALFPELFKSEQYRAKTNALRQVFQFIAMIISIALTPVITGAIGYSLTSIIYGILAISVITYMTLGCREDPAAMDKPKPNLFKSIKEVAVNPKFWLYGLTNATFFSALGLLQAGVPFYVKYHLNAEGLSSSILLGVVILSAILFIPVWVIIIKKITLLPAWRTSLLITALSILPLYLTKTLFSASLFAIFLGFGMAGSYTSMDIVGARIMDEDSMKHGLQREGTFSSLMGVLNKVGGLFTAFAFFLVFTLYGFESGDNPGTAPHLAARFLTVIFPAIVMLICALLSHFLRFKEKR